MSGRPTAGPAPRRTAPASVAPTNAGALQLGPCQRMRPRCLRWSFRQWVLKNGVRGGRILMYSYHIVADQLQSQFIKQTHKLTDFSFFFWPRFTNAFAVRARH